jgi:hypothetical protein
MTVSLHEALFALLLQHDADTLTVSDVLAVVAHPEAHADRVQAVRAEAQAELAAGGATEILRLLGLTPPASSEDWVHLAAALYQVAGAYNLPVRVLDVLSAAQHNEPFAPLIEGILPMETPEHLQAEAVEQVVRHLNEAIVFAAMDEESPRSLDHLRMARAFILQAAGADLIDPEAAAPGLADGPWQRWCCCATEPGRGASSSGD